MKYTAGKIGRVVVAKIEDGDDLLDNLCAIVKKEKILSGVVFLIGALNKNKLVCGPLKGSAVPPLPFWRDFSGPAEIIGTGTIFRTKGEPKIHLHISTGRGDKTLVGCLRNKSKVSLIVEAVIMEIKGVKACRKLDPKTGLTLLDIGRS